MKTHKGLTHIHGEILIGKTMIAQALAWHWNLPSSIIFEQDGEEKITKKEVLRKLEIYGRVIIIAEPFFIKQKGYHPEFCIECK